MKTQLSKELIVNPHKSGAIINNEFHGFREDYLVLHCLLKIHQPYRILEIGTNMGTGTNIITNALPNSIVYSLDLPPEKAHISLQHPISEGKKHSIGYKCKLPYTQILADSMEYDYTQIYHLDCAYIDGEHIYPNVKHETQEMIKAGCRIIIWHDSDMPKVMRGIKDGLSDDYELTRVADTRISYALKNG